MPDAGVLATVLLIAGLFLLVLEFFVPSFGLIGIIAALCLLISFWSAYQAWGGGRNPAFFWTFTVFLVCGVPGTIAFGFYMLQYSAVGRAVVLQPPKFATQTNPLDKLIGKHGLTQTLLTPGGMVTIEKNRYHAESLGMIIDPNSRVVVVEVRSNRLVVRPATPEDVRTVSSNNDDSADPVKAIDAPLEPATGQPGDSDKLDFDIPENYTA